MIIKEILCIVKGVGMSGILNAPANYALDVEMLLKLKKRIKDGSPKTS